MIFIISYTTRPEPTSELKDTVCSFPKYRWRHMLRLTLLSQSVNATCIYWVRGWREKRLIERVLCCVISYGSDESTHLGTTYSSLPIQQTPKQPNSLHNLMDFYSISLVLPFLFSSLLCLKSQMVGRHFYSYSNYVISAQLHCFKKHNNSCEICFSPQNLINNSFNFTI